MKADIGLFGRMLFPRVLNKPIPQFHREIYDLLIDDSVKRRAIIAPRSHSKSTLCSFVYPMWQICFNDPDDPKFIVLISESQDQAANFIATIQAHLEDNPRLRALITEDLYGVPSLVGDRWTQTDFITRNSVRIKALGSGQKIRGINYLGKRPTVIILDDFESETNTGTAELRYKNSDWVSGAVEPSLDDDGTLTIVGTVVHQKTYLTATRKDSRFRSLFYVAEADGKPLWPERFPVERLEEMKNSLRAEGKMHVYYREFMNDPINREEQAFREEDFQYWDGDIFLQDGQPVIRIKQPDHSYIEKPVNTYVGVDLAISSRGDYNVILLQGIDSFGNVYIHDYYRGRGSPSEIIDEIFKFKKAYAPSLVVVETTAYQQALAHFLLQEMSRRGDFFAIQEVKPRDAKDIRLMALQPMFTAKRIYHKKRHVELEQELLAFPKATNDDVCDALWSSVTFANKCLHESLAHKESFDDYSVPNWRVQ